LPLLFPKNFPEKTGRFFAFYFVKSAKKRDKNAKKDHMFFLENPASPHPKPVGTPHLFCHFCKKNPIRQQAGKTGDFEKNLFRISGGLTGRPPLRAGLLPGLSPTILVFFAPKPSKTGFVFSGVLCYNKTNPIGANPMIRHRIKISGVSHMGAIAKEPLWQAAPQWKGV